jgi:ribulose kinase
MNEGGQSSTGQLIHFILTTHHSYPELEERAKQEGKAIHIGAFS